MSVNLKGTLRDPMGNIMPLANIRFTATQGVGEMVEATFATFTTNGSGNYDFNVVDGVYYIEILQQNPNDLDEYKNVGNALINAGTPSPITLGKLLKYTTPIPPQDLVELEATWESRFKDLFDHYATITQNLTRDLTDGDTFVYDSWTTWTNDITKARAAERLEITRAETAKVTELAFAYSDDTGSEFAQKVLEASTSAATATSELIAYQDANGKALAQQKFDLEVADGNVTSAITTAYEKYTDALETRVENFLTVGDDSLTEQLVLARDALGVVTSNWQIEASVGEITSSIGMVTTDTDSEVYIISDKLTFTDRETYAKPFFIKDGAVHLQNVVLEAGANTLPTDPNLTVLERETLASTTVFVDSPDTELLRGDYTRTVTSSSNIAGLGFVSVYLKDAEGGITVYFNGVLIGTPVGANNKELWYSFPANVLTSNSLLLKSNVRDGSIIRHAVVTVGGIGALDKIVQYDKLYNPSYQSKVQIRSSDYVAGSKGWSIKENGDCEFSDGVFRGDLYASSLTLVGDGLTDKYDNTAIDYDTVPYPDTLKNENVTVPTASSLGLFGTGSGTTQSPLVISGGGYTAGSNVGWGIFDNGIAVFNEIRVRTDGYIKDVTISNCTIEEDCIVKGQLTAGAAKIVSNKKECPFIIRETTQRRDGNNSDPMVVVMPPLYSTLFAGEKAEHNARRCAHQKSDVHLEVFYVSNSNNHGFMRIKVTYNYIASSGNFTKVSNYGIAPSSWDVGTIPYMFRYTTDAREWSQLTITIEGYQSNSSGNDAPLAMCCKYEVYNHTESRYNPNTDSISGTSGTADTEIPNNSDLGTGVGGGVGGGKLPGTSLY